MALDAAGGKAMRAEDTPHEHSHEHPHEHDADAPRDPRDLELEAIVARVGGELADSDPLAIARRAGVEYDPDEGSYAIRVYGKVFAVKHPTLETHEASADHHLGALWLRVLLAHYLRTADGTPLAGQWVTLRDLPGGLMYERAFQGYSGDELAKAFGPEFESLRTLGPRYGAQPLSLGDLGLRFDVLPMVPIAVVCYAGDDEFAASAQLLFDAAATRYLPTDALATLGGRLTRLLLQAAGISPESAKPITTGWLGR
jgi:Domain of unknown function (DUF3786)